jgi:hypothetical protein
MPFIAIAELLPVDHMTSLEAVKGDANLTTIALVDL